MTQLTIRFKFIKLFMIWTLLLGTIVSCSKKDSTPVVPPADKTALAAAIAVATNLNNNTVEGTKPGQYEVGSKAALNTALTASVAVNNNSSASQASVNNALAQLNAAIATYQSHLIKEIAAANLIGFWKFNGNTNDSSGKGNNGVATTGAAYFGAGTLSATADRFNRAGMAYHFDHGANVDVPYSTSLNPTQMTISVWAKWTSTGRLINTDTYTMVAMKRWLGYKFQLQSNHFPFYTVRVKPTGDTTIYDKDANPAAIAENEWHHLVVTFKSGVERFYVDGDMVKEWTDVPGDAVTVADQIDFVIGQDLPTNKYLTVDGDFQVAWGGFWTGDMDDVMFYNIALEGPQVKSIYDNQKTL
jgi:hypothetical protein